MYSVKAEIVRWEEESDVEARSLGWKRKLTIRHIRTDNGENVFRLDPELIGAVAKIDGNAIRGSIGSAGGEELYICFFETDVDFKIGAVCTVTWENYGEW